jgi:hypothetical protein
LLDWPTFSKAFTFQRDKKAFIKLRLGKVKNIIPHVSYYLLSMKDYDSNQPFLNVMTFELQA